jgi:transcriptional regulator with XRE-family HTH domain/tetratricopeptide (TPR) repeat protein
MAEQPDMTFALLLRRLRDDAQLTQEELADAATLSPRSVSDLERGVNRTARKVTAQLLARALSLEGQAQALFVAAARGLRPAEDVLAAQSGKAVASYAETAGTTYAEPDAEDDDAGASNLVWVDFAASRRFVGRDKELEALREAWAKAAAGNRVLALVAGEPGIGKTALAAELARGVQADGGLVLYGRWGEEVLAPYQAFREALGDYARSCPEVLLRHDLREVVGEVARLCPEAAQRIGSAAAPLLGAAEADRLRLFDSLDTWLQRIAARRPLLIVLDDLHWADQPSFLLLRHLMQARRPTPILAVAMYRNVALERSDFAAVLPSLARDTDCRRLSIRGLDIGAVGALVRSVAGKSLGAGENVLVSDLERETAGNPFFLMAIALHLSEVGLLDQGVFRLGEQSAEIPESVRDLVRWRVGRLSDTCAETLSVASVLGERFDAAVLGVIAGLDDATTVDVLEEAAGAGLIAEIRDEPDWWWFSHSLTRRVILDGLSASRKTRLHQRIGNVLEARSKTPPAEIAHHFRAAASLGTADKAVRYERLAGKRALAEVAAEVALRHFMRALELHDRLAPEDETRRCEVLLELADAHNRAGEYALRDERFAEAAETARRLGRSDLFAQAATGYGGVLPATVSPDPRARALLEEALDQLGESERAARAMMLARLAHWLHNELPYAQRRELSDRSVAMARSAGDPQTLAAVLLHRGWALDGPGDVRDALAVADEILDIGAGLEQPELTLEGLRLRLATQFETGDQQAAMQTADALRDLAQRVRHPEFVRLAAMWDITLASLAGRFDEAEDLSQALHRRLEQIGHPQAQLILVAQTFSWRWLQGRAGEYAQIFEALSASEPANLAWRAVLAWCLAEGGAREEATELLGRTTPDAAAAADENYLWWAVLVGFSDAVDLLGDERWAEVLYDMAVKYAGHNCTLGVASCFGAVDHWLGVLAGVDGRFSEAVRHFEAALERHSQMGARPLEALTQEAYAHVLSMRGQAADSERASVLLESAMRVASELGLAAISDRARLRS